MTKKRIFSVIQIGNKEDFPSRFFDIFIVCNILVNICVMFMQTFDELSAWAPFFRVIELVTTLFFVVEYALRIWTAEYLYPDKSFLTARIRFLFSYDGIVDLFTIIPAFFLSGFVAFRLLRVVRIFHLFRLNAQYDSFNVITEVFLEKKNQLASSIFIIAILMLGSSMCMYSVEHEAQPGVFANAFSGIWWSVSTVLTVGYGDIYPVTTLGKLMGIVIAFLGVGVVAIPTGIISAGFVEQYTEKQKSERTLTNEELADSIDEIIIPAGSAYAGMELQQIRHTYGLKGILVVRGNLRIVADPTLVIEEGDLLIALHEGERKSEQMAGSSYPSGGGGQHKF